MRVLPYGARAVLLELADADAVASVLAALTALVAEQPTGVQDLVPGARTVLVHFRSPAERGQHWPDLLAEARSSRRPDQLLGPLMHVPVTYDGEDLAPLAAEIGLSVAEVVELHTRGEYRVAFCGFSPGFAYLVGLDPRLQVSRRNSPRTRVPAGSVAVAGEYTAVYPAASPGGWRLLGRTAVRMWDSDRTPPALLTPGTRVRFTLLPNA